MVHLLQCVMSFELKRFLFLSYLFMIIWYSMLLNNAQSNNNQTLDPTETENQNLAWLYSSDINSCFPTQPLFFSVSLWLHSVSFSHFLHLFQSQVFNSPGPAKHRVWSYPSCWNFSKYRYVTRFEKICLFVFFCLFVCFVFWSYLSPFVLSFIVALCILWKVIWVFVAVYIGSVVPRHKYYPTVPLL